MGALTRRELLYSLGSVAAAGIAAGPGANSVNGSSTNSTDDGSVVRPPEATKMPVVYLPHGGGPWPFVESGFGAPGALEKYLRKLGDVPPVSPRALLVVSAHWEAERPTVMTSKHPPMLYDYYGFPEAAYRVTWPAPGDPASAEEVRDLLESSGIPSETEPARGFDHGTFVVGALAYPDASIPTFQLSLRKNLSPLDHLRIGRAIAPLRDRGIFIIGSGMSYHNLSNFVDAIRGRPGTMEAESLFFNEWLIEAVTSDPDVCESRLVEWERAPFARACHPREEHLLPLMVIAGAAGSDVGRVPYSEIIYGAHTSAVQFGNTKREAV